MRPVLFLFYTVEIFLNVLLLTFHVEGIIKQPVDYMPLSIRIRYGIYTLSYYLFNSLTMWASVNLSLGQRYRNGEEIVRNFVGFLLYIFISLCALNDAETDFHLMYTQRGIKDDTTAVHPFVKYMRFQAIITMINGLIYLLHCIIVVDVVLAGIAKRESHADKKKQGKDEPEIDFKPVRVYFLGKQIDKHLEQFQWFKEFRYAEYEVL